MAKTNTTRFWMLIGLLAPSACQGFVQHRGRPSPSFLRPAVYQQQTTSLPQPATGPLSMTPFDDAITSMSSMVLSSTTVDPLSFLWDASMSAATTSSSSTASSSSSSTNVLSQCLGGVAHLCLDFTGMTGASKLLIRLLTILGRVCVLSADYLPDHSINTQEMIIQIILMYLAVKEFASSSSSSSSSSSPPRSMS